jgi:hypothetical protein
MADDVLNTDDPARPGNLTADEYWAEHAEYAAAHPMPELPADAYELLPDDDGAE